MSASPDPLSSAFTLPELVDRLNDPLVSPTLLFCCVESFNKAIQGNDNPWLPHSVAPMLLPALCSALRRHLGKTAPMDIGVRYSVTHSASLLMESQLARALPITREILSVVLEQLQDPSLQDGGRGALQKSQIRGVSFTTLLYASGEDDALADFLLSRGLLDFALKTALAPYPGGKEGYFPSDALILFDNLFSHVLNQRQVGWTGGGGTDAPAGVSHDALAEQVRDNYLSTFGKYVARADVEAAIPALAAVMRDQAHDKDTACGALAVLPHLMMLMNYDEFRRTGRPWAGWKPGIEHGVGTLAALALQRWPDYAFLTSSAGRVLCMTTMSNAGGETERKTLVQGGCVEALVKAMRCQATFLPLGNAPHPRSPHQTELDQKSVLGVCSEVLEVLVDGNDAAFAAALRAGLDFVIAPAKASVRDGERGHDAVLALQEKLRQFRRVCAACGKEKAKGAIGLKSCPCHSAWYCNAACQAAHWSEHKLLCPRRASKASSA